MRHVSDDIVNDELIVHSEANAQAVNGLTGFPRALAGNDKVVGFDIGEGRFNVPHAVFPLEA
jgi:hypothetical protein